MKTILAILALAGCAHCASAQELTVQEYIKIAEGQYPAIKVAGTPLNQRWLAIYQELRATQPAFFQNPAWPVLLADQAAKSVASGSAGKTVRLEANAVAGGKIIDRNWQASWGSFDRDYARSSAVRVRVSTVSREKFDATVEVYFIGKTLADGQRRLAAKTTAKVRVDNAPTEVVMHSGPVESSEQRYYALGEHYVRGMKLEGWYCQVVASGAVLARAASATYLKDLYDDPQELARLR